MALNLGLVLACFAATLRMQLTRALALDSQQIASQVLQVAFPVLVELTVEHQSYRTLLALDTGHNLGFLTSKPLALSREDIIVPTRLETRRLLEPMHSTLV